MPITHARRQSDGRIELLGPRSLGSDGFISDYMPAARYSTKSKTWRCQATPAAAARLQRYAATTNPEIVIDHEIEAIASWWPSREVAAPEVGAPGLWDHQLDTIQFAAGRLGTLLALDMGCGKTRVALELMGGWGSKLNLVVCPAKVQDVWPGQVAKFGYDFQSVVLTGTSSAKKAAQLDIAIKKNKGSLRPMIVVTNYESAWRPALEKGLLSRQWGTITLDESHRIKSPGSKVSQFCEKLGRHADRRLCLTGTPMPHSPLDVWAQIRFLDAGMLGRYRVFRHRYAVMHPLWKTHVLRFQRRDELAQVLSDIMIQFKTRDVMDLPPLVSEPVTLSLSSDAQAVYDKLNDSLIAEWEGGTVSAANAVVKCVRLQQITSGFVKTDDGQIQVIDSTKQDTLGGHLDSMRAGERLVVFCRFRVDLERAQDEAKKAKRWAGEISGQANDLATWNATPGGVLAVQVQSGSEGNDMTAACYCCFWSSTWSLGQNDQCIARLMRPGQTHPVVVLRLTAVGTIDQTMDRAIEKRRNVVKSVLDNLGRSKSDERADCEGSANGQVYAGRAADDRICDGDYRGPDAGGSEWDQADCPW